MPRTPGSQEEHLGAKKNTLEAPINHDELTYSVWGPICHVIYLWM
jgi:hypothetical protein